MPGSRKNWKKPEVVCREAWALLMSTVVALSKNSGSDCVKKRPLAAPVTYIGPKNGATSKWNGSGLAASGPDSDGVVIALEVGAAGAAAGAAGGGAPGGGGGGGCCAIAGAGAATCHAAAIRHAVPIRNALEKLNIIDPFPRRPATAAVTDPLGSTRGFGYCPEANSPADFITSFCIPRQKFTSRDYYRGRLGKIVTDRPETRQFGHRPSSRKRPERR